MESPFGFIEGFQMQIKAKAKQEDRDDDLEKRKQDALLDWDLSPEMNQRMEGLFEKEKVMEEKLDAVATNMSKKFGYSSTPWLKLTWWLLIIYTVLTICVLFYRSDFINLTVCIIAIYMLLNTT